MGRLVTTVIALTLVAAACGDSDADEVVRIEVPPRGPGTTSSTVPPTIATSPPGPGELQGLALEEVASGLTNPLLVTAPAGDARLFVIEQPGLIRLVLDGELAAEPFLDLTGVVGSGQLEQGLLGLAFHPAYHDNGRFFVHYTDKDGDTTLAEYSVSAGEPDLADVASARTILTTGQPAGNHNGGMIQFGPDGYLYMALGDGRGANDQFGHGQRADTLLGTIIRLDVDAAFPYAVPPDNPFDGAEGLSEVWAYGLRNPWRFAIDAAERMIYIGDVGQSAIEEIDIAPLDEGGLNYGWSITEGLGCFDQGPCDRAGLREPALFYGRAHGCSVIGGYVYRGAAIPELDGHYFYADWCRRWVRSFRYDNGAATAQQDWTADLGQIGQPLSFGQDAAGELYLTTADGVVHRIVPRR